MRSFIIRIAFLALPILLTACAHRSADLTPQPAPEQLATPQAVEAMTAVDVTEKCINLIKPRPFPHDYSGKNVYISRKQWIAVAKLQQKQLAETGSCIIDTHDSFAKGLPTK